MAQGWSMYEALRSFPAPLPPIQTKTKTESPYVWKRKGILAPKQAISHALLHPCAHP